MRTPLLPLVWWRRSLNRLPIVWLCPFTESISVPPLLLTLSCAPRAMARDVSPPME